VTGQTGTFTALGTPSGTNVGGLTAALTQVTALFSAINAAIVAPTPLSGPIGTYTFTPGFYDTLDSPLVFNNSTLTFTGLPTDQIFIIAPASITFTGTVTMTLNGGILPENIFWVGSGTISTVLPITTPVYGVFLSVGDITFGQAVTVIGNLYSLTGSVTFNASSAVTSSITPAVNICFPADTPVHTDQGVVPIALLNPSFHTIRGQRIVALTQTILEDDYMMCFEKNSIRDNVPNRRTLISPHHKILHNGQLVKAHVLPRLFIGKTAQMMYKVKYDGYPVYNVLMNIHDKINVNNMICETLDPNTEIARMYTNTPIEHGVEMLSV
jgi:hypothetical protein